MSTDLPVHISHGVLQGLHVVHQVGLQIWEHLPGVCLLQSDHSETGQRKMKCGGGEALLISDRQTLQEARSSHQLGAPQETPDPTKRQPEAGSRGSHPILQHRGQLQGWWGSWGPYQQQVLHLVLGSVARGCHVLKRKGKGAV